METGDHANRPDRSGICHLSMGSRQESLSRSAEPVAALVLPVAVWMVVYDEDHHDNIRILQIHLHHVPIHDGMSSGQLRETLLKKPLLYIRWVAGDGYVRGLRIIGHIDVIVSKNPLATAMAPLPLRRSRGQRSGNCLKESGNMVRLLFRF